MLQGPRHVWKKRRLQTTSHFSFITLLWFKSEESRPTWAVKRRTSSWTLETRQKYKAWGLRSNFNILCIHFASSSLKSSFLSQYFKKFWHVCHWILPEPASKTQMSSLKRIITRQDSVPSASLWQTSFPVPSLFRACFTWGHLHIECPQPWRKSGYGWRLLEHFSGFNLIGMQKSCKVKRELLFSEFVPWIDLTSPSIAILCWTCLKHDMFGQNPAKPFRAQDHLQKILLRLESHQIATWNNAELQTCIRHPCFNFAVYSYKYLKMWFWWKWSHLPFAAKRLTRTSGTVSNDWLLASSRPKGHKNAKKLCSLLQSHKIDSNTLWQMSSPTGLGVIHSFCHCQSEFPSNSFCLVSELRMFPLFPAASLLWATCVFQNKRWQSRNKKTPTHLPLWSLWCDLSELVILLWFSELTHFVLFSLFGSSCLFPIDLLFSRTPRSVSFSGSASSMCFHFPKLPWNGRQGWVEEEVNVLLWRFWSNHLSLKKHMDTSGISISSSVLSFVCASKFLHSDNFPLCLASCYKSKRSKRYKHGINICSDQSLASNISYDFNMCQPPLAIWPINTKSTPLEVVQTRAATAEDADERAPPPVAIFWLGRNKNCRRVDFW